MAYQEVALITGASSGIGEDIADVLAAKGWKNLVLVARRGDRLEAVAAKLRTKYNATVTLLIKDLREPGAAAWLDAELRNRQIDVHLLVNNAGFSSHGAVTDVALDQMNAMVQVNIVALMELTRLIAPQMVARGKGRVMNLASVVSYTPAPFAAVYAATKAFVLSFSEALSEELKGTGVTVTAVCPGTTESEFKAVAGMTNTNAFRGKGMSSAEVAELAVKAMLAGKQTVVTGMANKVVTFFMRITPHPLLAKITRSIMSPAK